MHDQLKEKLFEYNNLITKITEYQYKLKFTEKEYDYLLKKYNVSEAQEKWYTKLI